MLPHCLSPSGPLSVTHEEHGKSIPGALDGLPLCEVTGQQARYLGIISSTLTQLAVLSFLGLWRSLPLRAHGVSVKAASPSG